MNTVIISYDRTHMHIAGGSEVSYAPNYKYITSTKQKDFYNKEWPFAANSIETIILHSTHWYLNK